jgi:hypothetical protein
MTTSAIDIEKIKAADYAHLIHPLFHPTDQKDPFVWVKGEGSILYNADGKQYLDGLSGLWNVSLGHGRKDLAAAGARQNGAAGFCFRIRWRDNVPAVQMAEETGCTSFTPRSTISFLRGRRRARTNPPSRRRGFFWITQGKPEMTKIHQPRFRLSRRHNGRDERDRAAHLLAHVWRKNFGIPSHQVSLSLPICFG